MLVWRASSETEQGQVLPLVAALIAVIGVMAVQVGRVGEAAYQRAQAQTAADAAALAGVADGRAGAESVARANRGRLVSYREIDADVQVTVRLGDATAEARARGSAGGGAAWAQGSSTGLAPAMRAAIARAAALLGRPIPITSGFRSIAQQRALWARRHTNPYPVAPPGTSMHGRGLAIDVPRSFVPVLLRVARQAGLCQPYPRNDPIHFELCR
ncbi:MAG: M15 family metallopeptidase [Actinobacteria bacterium]|nr:M15 family metallopeptidase [Actinomycetota bacterium]